MKSKRKMIFSIMLPHIFTFSIFVKHTNVRTRSILCCMLFTQRIYVSMHSFFFCGFLVCSINSKDECVCKSKKHPFTEVWLSVMPLTAICVLAGDMMALLASFFTTFFFSSFSFFLSTSSPVLKEAINHNCQLLKQLSCIWSLCVLMHLI